MPQPPRISLEQFPVVLTLPVVWGDQDAFRHVNNTVFFRWFESGRVAYLDRCKIATTVDDQNIGPILAAISCNFRQQVNFPDQVQIGTRIRELGRTSVHIEQAIFSTASGLLVADGESTVVCFDYTRNRPTPITDQMRTAFEAMEQRQL